MRVALYARVSTLDKGQETRNQLAQLHEHCAKSGFSVVRIFEDHASAKNGDRVMFKEMFAAARRKEFDLVLFWALDRFTREGVAATLNYLNELTSAGVEWRSFTEQYLDSCGVFKDAVLAILATIAKQERLRISERTKAGIERARRAGKQIGGRKLVMDCYKIADLREQGHSLRAIARKFDTSLGTIQNRLREAALLRSS